MDLIKHATAAATAVVVAVAFVTAGCGASGSGHGSTGGAVRVVATTTVLGDVARAVGGDAAKVTQVLRPNADPHEYEPRPDDVIETSRARVVLLSGDNLDRWMSKVVEQSGAKATTVDLASRLRVRLPGESSGPEASRYDPHWWHDPRNVETAVAEIRDALSAADPGGKATFARNAAAYLRRVERLDTGISRCMATVPRAQRKLVTDHDAFGYFAQRYAITTIGAVIPSQTTQAQSSAGQVADLTRLIEREHVKAVFPEKSVNQRLVQAIARQTGASARYTLYGDTLGAAGTPGATYLGMEQANADAMVRGFTGGTRGCTIAGL